MSKIETSKYRAEEIAETLLGMGDQRQAQLMQRFFKTGPGQYGEGDRFIGLKNPQVRLVVKESWKNTPLQEAVALAKSPWHEVRLCGLLIMVEHYLKAMKRQTIGTHRANSSISQESELLSTQQIYDTYLSLHPYINNWDLVDLSAFKIVGNHEANQRLNSGILTSEMDEWIKPGHTLWQQRIAMVSSGILIHKGIPEVTFQRAQYMLASQHDLLHKAAGWMLREAWKHGYREDLRDFLQTHVKGMPSIMLSYACEQMSLDERHHWQHLRKS